MIVVQNYCTERHFHKLLFHLVYDALSSVLRIDSESLKRIPI